MRRSVWIFVLLLSVRVASAQAEPAAAVPATAAAAGELRPGAETAIKLEPSGSQSWLLSVRAGQVSTVVFRQVAGTAKVSWMPEGRSEPAPPRQNQSGKGSAIVFHAIGAESASASATVRGTFAVQNGSRRPAELRVTVSAARPFTARDLELRQAEGAMSEAAALLADRAHFDAPKCLAALAAAERHWREADEQAELLRTLALTAYAQAFPGGDGAGAVSRATELISLAAAVEGQDATEAANAYKMAGFVYAKQAVYPKALEQYNTALPLYEKTGDVYNQVVVRENRAKIERIEGRNGLALADVEAAIPLAEQNQDLRGEMGLEVERGAIAYASGRLGLAYEASLKAVTLAADTPDDFLEALAWSDIALIDTQLHAFEEGARALDRAEQIWKKTKNEYGALQTLEDRGELDLEAGDFGSARAVFVEGVERSEKLKLSREHAYFLHGLAVSEMRSHQLAQARSHMRQAVEEAERVDLADVLSTFQATDGDLAAEAGDWKQAAGDWKRAAESAAATGNTLNKAIALGGLARADVHLGDTGAALRHCGGAMEALESIREGIGDADLRLSFFSSRHEVYDLCVQTELGSGDGPAAFDVAERGRSRLLLDEAAASGMNGEFPDDLLKRIGSNSEALETARRRAVRAAHGTRPELRNLLAEREQLRGAAAKSGLTTALSAATVPYTHGEAMGRLDAGTALAAYWLGRNQSSVWLMTRAGLSQYQLPPAPAIEQQVKRYLRALLAPYAHPAASSAAKQARALEEAATEARRQGELLRRTLLPMRIPAGIGRLVIVNDGALGTLSFAALPASSGGYLGQQFEFITEPSVTLAFRPAANTAASGPRLAIAFVDPAVKKPQQANKAGASPLLGLAAYSAPLPFAQSEAQSLRESFGEANTTVFAGSGATRTRALGADWSRYSVAHFATHGVYRATHAELSGLVLAGGDGGAILSFSDVLRMKPGLELAVLSACNSGVGEFVPGEGMVGLDRAFLASGTARVIGTLWPVDDEASSVFMEYFYRSLGSTHSPSLSLRAARRQMAASSQWSAPYYWGAFSLSGDWHGMAD